MKNFAFLTALASLILLNACQPSMTNRGRLKPFAPMPIFANGTLARHPVDGTVAVDAPLRLEVFKDPNTGDYRKDFPVVVDEHLIRRGQNRFEIYCSPCHGILADGKGPVVLRGFLPPPSLHSDLIRERPNGFYFEAITNGFGAMFAYGDRLSPRDRWAVIAYIRALQLSQNFPYKDLAPDEMARLPAPEPSPEAQ